VKVALVPLGPDAAGRVGHLLARAEGLDLHAVEVDGRPVGALATERRRHGRMPALRPGEVALRAVALGGLAPEEATEAAALVGPYLAAQYPGAGMATADPAEVDPAALRALRAAGFAPADDDARLRCALPRMRRRDFHGWRRRVGAALVGIRRRVPPGLRLVLGLLLMAGGVLSFLPILGIWMFPIGVAVAALDVKPLWRWLMGRGR
jgi:hypothetical protein